MTKKQAVTRLVKDIILAVAATIIIAFIFTAMGACDFAMGLLAGFMLSGIPFGWRWLSKIFTALGLLAIIAKFFGAMLLGWLALPIVLIKDIIQVISSAKAEKNGTEPLEIIEK